MDIEHDKRKYSYKPPYEKLKGAKSLLRLLKQHDLDLDKKGGILLSELADSMPNPDKALEVSDFCVQIYSFLNQKRN